MGWGASQGWASGVEPMGSNVISPEMAFLLPLHPCQAPHPPAKHFAYIFF